MLTNPDKDLFGGDAISGRDQMLTDGLHSARSELEKLMGSNPSQWSWGRLHTVSFRHALDQQPDAKDFFDLGPVSRPGDEYTVNATGGNTWEQISGASYREILDTSNWDQSVAVNTPRPSDQPGSFPHLVLVPLWDAVDYLALGYSK